MTRLGNQTLIRRRTPQSDGRIVQVPRGGQLAKAAVEAANTAQGVITERLQKRDKLQYARARASFIRERGEIERELARDPDWQSYEKRFGERIKGAKNRALGMLDGADAQRAFETDVVGDIAAGHNNIMLLAFRRERDEGIANLNEVLENSRHAYLEATTPEEKHAIVEATQVATEGAHEAGYIGQADIERKRLAWSNSLAKGELQTMAPGEQLKALNSTRYQNILHKDERTVIKRAAQNQIRIEADRLDVKKRRAEAEARKVYLSQLGDRLVDAASTKAQMYEMIEGTDLQPDERNAIASHWEQRHKAMKGERLVGAIKEAQDGNMPDPDTEAELRADGSWNKVKNVLEGKDIVTDWDLYGDLYGKMKQGGPTAKSIELNQYADRLNEVELKKLHELQQAVRSNDAAKVRSMVTDNQRLMTAAGIMKIKPDKKPEEWAAFTRSVTEAEAIKQEQLGRVLTPAEKQEVIDELIVETVTQEGIFYDSTVRRYELDVKDIPAGVEDDVIEAWNDPKLGPEWFKRTLGIDANRLTPELIAEAYEKMQALQGE